MSEEEIIRLCKDGDRDAFDELVKMHQSKIVNMAYGMLSDREDAFDATQEVFVRVYKNIDSFKGNSSFSTWIYRICVNVCSDMLRKRQRGGNIISINTAYSDDDKEMDICDGAPTPEEYAQLSEKQAAIRTAISKLKDEYRAVITLFDIEGLSYDEISVILKLPSGTVKSRLNRARNALKKILSENMELFE